MADEINTSVPLSLHPQVLEVIDADFQSDPVVGVARSALDAAHISFTATVDGHKRVMQDPTHTPTANLQRSATAAAKRHQQALQHLDSAVERITREIQFIDEAMAKQAEPPPSSTVELVATRLSNMKHEERSKIISEAMRTGQTGTINAVLWSVDPWLFGMTMEEREMWRHQYRQANSPQAIKRKAALEQAVERLKLAGQSMHIAHAKMFDKKKLDDAAARAKAAEEALS